MSNHLTDQQVKGYRHSRLSPEELLAIDEHMSCCGECASLIEDPDRVRESLELWRSDFEVAQPSQSSHISYEQLAAYVDEATDFAKGEIVESHLKTCTVCSDEVADLRRFSVQFGDVTVRQSEREEKRSPQIAERFMAIWSRRKLWVPLQAAATVLIIILVVWLFARSLRTQNAELKAQLAQAQQEKLAVQQENNEASSTIENLQSQVAALRETNSRDISPDRENRIAVTLRDGEGQITLDRAGNLTGLKSLLPMWQQTVKTTLLTEHIQISPTVSNLIGKSGALMGGSGDGIAFSLLGPVGTAVMTDRPTFRWSAVSGAASYLVAVYDSSFNWVATSQPITAPSWTSSASLRRGETYFWQVTAMKDGKEIKSPVPPAPEARFRVIEQSKLDELSRIRKSASNSHLAAGLIYSKEGLLDDGERELEALLRANPRSTIAQKLLTNLKGLRQAKR